MAAIDTRNKILKTALKLFNSKGASQVSTNQIAEAAEISKGNLHYHYKNKEMIISQIFDEMVENVVVGNQGDEPATLTRLQEELELLLLRQWKYRFFQRELVSLLRKDPVLKKKYKAYKTQRWTAIETFMYGLERNGFLNAGENQKSVSALIKTCWIIYDYWLSYLDVNDIAVNKENIREGVDLIFQVIRPHLNIQV